MKSRTLIPVLFFVLASFASIGCGLTHVEAGNVGVEIDSCSGGGVSAVPVPLGYHFTGPCTSIEEFPTYQQTMTTVGAEAVQVTSSEGLPVNVETSLSFTVDAAKAPHIYEKFRQSIENIQSVYFRRAEGEALQETFAKYTAQQLYSDKKEVARIEVQKLLTDKLKADGFVVTQFTISKTTPPGEVIAAINAKVAMTQQAQQAEQAVKKAEAEGRQRVANAEADATATKMRADAEAYSNQKIASSLSAVLVEYKRVGKWDGKLPTFSGGGSTSFLLNGAK